MDKLRPCPFCRSNNVRIFNIWRKPIEIVCNECHSIYPNLIDKYKADTEEVNEALEQEPNTWSLDDAREDFTHDVYNTLDFLPTNNEANRIIDIFDRVTSSIKQYPILNKIRTEIEGYKSTIDNAISEDELKIEGMKEAYADCLKIIDKYKAESENEE